MVKKSYEDFVSQVDKFFTDSKDKKSIYFSFKRVFTENFKYKGNRKSRKQRLLDRQKQIEDTSREYSVLARAKLRKQRVHTIVEPKDLENFHNVLMKIFSLHFIMQTNDHKPKVKISAKKKKSNRQKRKEKKEKKQLQKGMGELTINK